MAYEELIEELSSNQEPAVVPATYQSAAANLLSALGQRFPSMQRVMQMSLANADESRVQDAMRLLSTNSPLALQQAVAVLAGRG